MMWRKGISSKEDFEKYLIRRSSLKIVTFDLEIAKDPKECGGWNFPERFGVSTVILYKHHSNDFLICDDKDYNLAQEELKNSDVIISYNGIGFDYPVLFEKKKGTKPDFGIWIDLMQIVWDALGKREKGWKLYQICEATLGIGKNDDGALAPEMYKKGQWGRLINYCLQDVIMTVRLAKFAAKYGYVKNARQKLKLKELPDEIRKGILEL